MTTAFGNFVHYNPFRSVSKAIKLYLESGLQKEVIMATPQRAYAHLVQARSNKTKRFHDWAMFSLAMLDKRIDKDQQNPAAWKVDGGIGGERVQDGTSWVYIMWVPMTFSFQLDIWADTRNRLESYLAILMLMLTNYPGFKIYYQENTLAYSVGVINLESASDTSNLDPGQEIVEFRHTITFDIKTQIPLKANVKPRIDEIFAHIYNLGTGLELEYDNDGNVIDEDGVKKVGTYHMDSTDGNINLTYISYDVT